VVDENLPEVRSGLNVGISISRSEDLARFGLTETHVRMALGEIARAVLVADGRLIYGGHLREDGYTLFLVQEIERFGRRNRPFTGYVPHSEHRQMSVDEINERVEDISVIGTYVFLDTDGRTIDPVAERSLDPTPVDESTEKSGLSAARVVMSDVIDGRVALGGQREGFRGRIPGVIEETILAVRAGKPVYVAGGYGGAAGDMAVALNIDNANWLGLDVTGNPYLDELREAVAEHGWEATANGLTEEENQRLAITYRASEVASLIVTGLSRLTRTK
jgi:SLOG cluster2